MPSLEAEEKKKEERLAERVIDRITTLAIASFGLVAALAWNDAIKAIFKIFFPKPEDNVIAQLIYAVVVTVIVVILSIFLTRSSRKLKKRINHGE